MRNIVELPNTPAARAEKTGRAPRFTQERIDKVLQSLKNCGVVIGRVEVTAAKVIIYSADNDDQESPYDRWNKEHGQR